MGRFSSLAYLALGTWAAYSLGVWVYVLGSFLLMHQHVAARPLRTWLREIVREAFFAFVTQPFLPLFYLVGRRMGGARRGPPIVLVHGYMQNRISFVGLAWLLGKLGLGPLYGFNYVWFGRIEDAAARLGRFIDDVLAETGASRVDLVTHSFGGLVALEYLHGASTPPVRRLVTIAGPHAGVAWRGPILGASGTVLRPGSEFIRSRRGRSITVPCLSIYSTHDNIVFPSTTSALSERGARDLAASEAGHMAILFERAVAEHVAAFLTEPTAEGGA